MSTTFTLAHISDIHLPLPAGLTIGHFRTKRLLGLANWHRHRKHAHQRTVLDRVMADIARAEADHLAVTGDLVNLGLPDEHEAALRWLKELGSPDQISVVPGNHDAYVRLSRHPGHLCWADYMSHHGWSAPSGARHEFPYVRRIGRVALIGLSSAVPTPPIVSYGRLGSSQTQALARLLRRFGKEGLARVVMVHHPPFEIAAAWRMGLTDARRFLDVLRAEGAELVLHGHLHRPVINWAQGPSGQIPLVGVASASEAHGRRPEDRARYHMFRLAHARSGWRIELVARGLNGSGEMHELDRRLLVGG